MRMAGLLFLIARFALGQQVDGQVVNAVTGQPVSKARVLLQNVAAGARTYPASTDAAGRFAIRAEPGSYRIEVRREGFVEAEYGARRTGRRGKVIRLSAGQQLKDLTIRLSPTAVVTGRVVDENGEPVTHAVVSLLCFRYSNGRKHASFDARATTNDVGEYRVFWLQPGRYYVSAAGRTGEAEELGDGSGEARLPTYYPGTTDLAAAAVLDVQPGAQLRGIDFVILKARTVRVRGRVTLPSEMTRGNARLSLLPRGQVAPHANRQTGTDGQGTFEFRAVTPGAYTLLAVVHAEGGRTLYTRQPVDVGGTSVENLNVVITAGTDVTGQVREADTDTPNFAGMRVVLWSRDSAGASSGAIREDGAFSIAHVAPDVYTLRIFPLREGYWVKSLRVGDKEVLDSGLDLTNGAVPAVSVVIAPTAGQVQGTVTDENGQPVFDAVLVLVPEAPRRGRDELYGFTTTGEDGRFTLRNIAPGDYKLFAWEDVEWEAWLDPGFLQPFESQGRPLTIREGGTETVELRAR